MLGSYMSGNNAEQARCRETQPVVMCYSPEARFWEQQQKNRGLARCAGASPSWPTCCAAALCPTHAPVLWPAVW